MAYAFLETCVAIITRHGRDGIKTRELLLEIANFFICDHDGGGIGQPDKEQGNRLVRTGTLKHTSLERGR